MKNAAGEANMTVIVIILIGVIAAVAIPIITSLMKSSTYRSCCTSAGGIWTQDYCVAPTPTSCENREAIWKSYDQCALNNGQNHANEYYRAVSCN